MVMQAVESRAIIRNIGSARKASNDMDSFMDTFDQAVTLPEGETFGVWAKRNRVIQCEVDEEEELVRTFLGHSPYLKSPGNRDGLIEATYFVGCINHGNEEEYLEFLSFLLSN